MRATRFGFSVVVVAIFAAGLVIARPVSAAAPTPGASPTATPAPTSTPTYHVSRYGNLEYYYDNDLTATGETFMNVFRVYNSYDNGQTGIFGVGWGSFYEENLQVQDDGSIIIHEYGGGASNLFTPTIGSLTPQDELRAEIMNAAGEVGQFGSDADKKAYEGMLADAAAEETTWSNLTSAGLIKTEPPPVGQTFFSGRYGTEEITRVPEGYQRETQRNGGSYYEAFNLSGELTRMWNKNHDFVALTYKNGHLSAMQDNQGNRFDFTVNDDGLVTAVKDARGDRVTYQYNDNDNLMSVNINGKITHYAYDAHSRLLSVTYPDGSATHMAYDPAGEISLIKSVDGTTRAYTFASQSTSTSRIDTMTTVTKTTDGKTHNEVDQYFSYAPKYYMAKEIDTIDGQTTTDTYDSDADVLTETTADETVTNTYDALDRIVSKRTLPSGSLTQWTYDPASGRPATITTTSKAGAVTTESFQYDEAGNLIHASSTSGQDFAVVHDATGRITSVTGDGSQLTFSYPGAGSFNATTVALTGVGVVTLSYAADGVVTGARSPGGSAIVAKVEAAVASAQQLLKDVGATLPAIPTPSS